METSETVTITAPADSIWAVLADFGRISAWAPNVDHSCLMSTQTEGVGMVRRIQVGPATVVERVIGWEPGARLAYAIEGLPPVVRSVSNTWSLDEAYGVTTVTLTSSIDTGPRPPQKAIARGVARTLGKASVQMLNGLNGHLKAVSA